MKAAYYSAAFIIRAAAADRLDIDPEELDISNVRRFELPDGSFAGEIIINDHLANGAGFTRWIGAHWRELLDSIVRPEAGSLGAAFVSPAHRSECDSSCPDCLRHYRNMRATMAFWIGDSDCHCFARLTPLVFRAESMATSMPLS